MPALLVILLIPSALMMGPGSSAGAERTTHAPATPQSIAANDIIPTDPNIDDGQSILLASNASGGSGGDTYQWYVGSGTGSCSSGSAVGTGASYDTGSLAASGSPFFFCYTVTDNSSDSASSAWDAVTVNPGLQSGSPTPSSPILDDGQSVILTPNPSGGSGGDSYQWYLGPGSGGCALGTLVGTTNPYESGPLASAGSPYYYCYVVTDSSQADGGPESASSPWDLVTVNTALTAPGSPIPSATTLDADQPLTVTGTIPSTGTPSYSWQWSISTDGASYSAASACSVNSGTGASGGATETCSIAANALTGGDTYGFELEVTDSATTPGMKTSSPSPTVTVNAPLAAGDATPMSPTIDAGQSVVLTGNPTGGSGSYSYQWYSGSTASSCKALGSPISSATTVTYTASPTNSLYYCYTVTDTYSDTATSPADQVSVNPGLTAPAAPAPSAGAIDADQPVTVTGKTPSSGTPTYSWQWLIATNGGSYTDATQCGASASGSGATGGTTETCTIPSNTLTASTSYTFELAITDSALNPESKTSSASSPLTVSSAFSSGSVSPSSPAIDGSQSITLMANPSGGTAPYSYQWYSSASKTGACDSGTALGTGASQSVSPGASTYYCYSATDSAHPPVLQSSGWDKVTVNPALIPGSPSPSAPSIDYGQAVTLTANPSGGTAPYVYRWHWSASDTGSCSSATALGSGATQTTGAEITAPGTYYYCYSVSDSSQASVGTAPVFSVWDTVTVHAVLTAPAPPTLSATALDVDQPLSATGVIPSNGTPTYAWKWRIATDGGAYSNATQCAVNSGSGATAGATETCAIASSKLTAGDTYAFELRVTDGAPSPQVQTSSASATVTVRSALTAPGAPTPSATALDADQPLTVAGKLPSTGTATYSWQWLISIGGGTYADASQCAASESGSGAGAGAPETCAIPGNTLTASTSYTFELKVVDSAATPESKTSPASSTVTTSSALTAGTPAPASPTIDSGQSITLSASPSGGKTPYSYQWYSGNSASECTALGSPISGETSPTYSASPTASTYYCYVVTDAHSDTATSGVDQLNVNPALTAPSAPTVTAVALDSDQSLTVTGTMPGTGTATYSWQWLVSVDGGAYAPATACALGNGAGAGAGVAEMCVLSSGSLVAGDTYTFELNVTDNASIPETATSSASSLVTVQPALTVPEAPTVSASALNGSQILTVTATIPSSGTPSYSWQWLVSTDGGAFVPATQCSTNGGTGASVGATETCNISATALTVGDTYVFELQVTDSATSSETQTSPASSAATVSLALSAGAPTPASPTIDDGQTITLTANPSGGSGSYSLQWYSGSTAAGCTGLSTPIAGATSSTYAASPSVTTYYCYTVTESSPTDTAGASLTSAPLLVTVHSPLSAPSAPATSATTLSANEAVTLTATIPSTGTAPYAWQWLVSVDGGAFVTATQCAVNSGVGAGGNASETCRVAADTLSAGHSYRFELQVTDSATVPTTMTSAATTPLTVTSVGTTPSASPFPWTWVYIGNAIAVIAAVALVALFALRARRPRPTAPPSSPQWEGPAVPPPESGPALPVPAPLESSVDVVREPAAVPEATAMTSVMPPATPGARRPVAPRSARPSASEVDSVMAELDNISVEILKRPPKIGTSGPAGSIPAEPDEDGEAPH